MVRPGGPPPPHAGSPGGAHRRGGTRRKSRGRRGRGAPSHCAGCPGRAVQSDSLNPRPAPRAPRLPRRRWPPQGRLPRGAPGTGQGGGARGAQLPAPTPTWRPLRRGRLQVTWVRSGGGAVPCAPWDHSLSTGKCQLCMCMCAFVHVSVHMPLYVAVHTCSCVYTDAHVSVHVCMHTNVYVCIYVCTCMSVCACTRVPVHTLHCESRKSSWS